MEKKNQTMVRRPKRIFEVISLLSEYWTLNPGTMDLRLGQIISNANKGHPVFYLEDEDLIIELKRLIAHTKEAMNENKDV